MSEVDELSEAFHALASAAGEPPAPIVPVFTDESATIYQGDNRDVVPQLAENSIDAIVTDPPYGIGFMGHEWDQPGEYGPVRANGKPATFASGRTDDHDHNAARDLERHMSRSARRGTHKAKGGAAHYRDREAIARGEPERPDAMEAGRYDLSPSANRRYQAWCEAWGRDLLRVAKPGAHLLSFGGTRTFHRLVAGLEDAGWARARRTCTTAARARARTGS